MGVANTNFIVIGFTRTSHPLHHQWVLPEQATHYITNGFYQNKPPITSPIGFTRTSHPLHYQLVLPEQATHYITNNIQH
jgi:hypothetical protein